MRKVRPNDRDAVNKYVECSKIVKRLAFEKAISTEHEKRSCADSIKLESMGEHVVLLQFFECFRIIHQLHLLLK